MITKNQITEINKVDNKILGYFDELDKKDIIGCGKKVKKEFVSYYKENVDNVERIIYTCGKEGFICDECYLKITELKSKISEARRLYENELKFFNMLDNFQSVIKIKQIKERISIIKLILELIKERE